MIAKCLGNKHLFEQLGNFFTQPIVLPILAGDKSQHRNAFQFGHAHAGSCWETRRGIDDAFSGINLSEPVAFGGKPAAAVSD